jgi:uncharacterized Fe-S center protein
MPSRVYFAPARGTPKANKFRRISRLLDRAGLDEVAGADALVAVKVHWGEMGNADFIPSFHIRHVVDRLLKVGARPFVTDTNTLYRGSRHNAVDNLQTARRNGFCEATLSCPVVVADGLRGTDYREVPVQGGSLVERARIASAVAEADAMVVVSHVKGHMVFGFGGAIKNLGMGCSASAAKQFLHADVRPRVEVDKCTGCGACVSHCAFDAIQLVAQGDRRVASIDLEPCAGCGECFVVCPEEAIPIDWEGDFAVTQRKTAEYAQAALAGKEGRALYLSFLVSITPDCDCCSWSDAPIVPDIGYLVSRDPVAIDKAAVDLVNEFTGHEGRDPVQPAGDRFRNIHGVDWLPTLEHAAALGLGSLDYELVQL